MQISDFEADFDADLDADLPLDFATDFDADFEVDWNLDGGRRLTQVGGGWPRLTQVDPGRGSTSKF